MRGSGGPCIGATSFLPGGGAKIRQYPKDRGLGRMKRAEVQMAKAVGDRVQGKACSLSLGKKFFEF